MEGIQSFNYQPFDFESDDMAIDLTQFRNDETSFHVDYSKILGDEVNTNNDAETPLSSSGLTSTWMNDVAVKGYGCLQEETVVANENIPGANEGLSGRTDSVNLVTELGSAHSNWFSDSSLSMFPLNRPDAIICGKETDANNGQPISDAFDFSEPFDFSKEMEISPEKQKTTMTNTAENINGLVGAFYEIDQDIHNTPRPVESTRHFATTKQSDLMSEGMESTQTYSKRKKAKTIDKVDGGDVDATNFAASSDFNKRVSKLGTTRGGNRNAKTRRSRGEKRFSSTFDDSTPVSSPEAEVPSSNDVVDDDELVTLETKELNKRVKFLPKNVVQEIKHRRRTLKNRGYARSCREKKMSEANTLQKSNGDLEKELASKRLELQLMMLERNDWKHKYEELFAACMKRGIQVEQ